MKNSIKIILLLCFFLLIQCNTEKEKSSDNKELESSSINVQDMLLNEYKDIIELVSLKYNLDTTISNNIVSSYLLETDLFYRIIYKKASNNEEVNVKDFFNERFSIIAFSDTIVSKYDNIDKEKLGQILFDIELLKQLKDIDSNN